MNYRRLTFRHLMLLLTLVGIWVLHTTGDKVDGDGRAYFLYCRQIFFYGDIDYHEEDGAVPVEYLHAFMRNGVLQTPFPVGPGLAWLPFYSMAHCASTLQSMFSGISPTGFERVYREMVGYGTLIYVAIGLYSIYLLLLRQAVPRFIAGLAVILGYLGTPLVNYAIFESSMPHGISFCVISLFLYLWWGWRSDLDYKRYMLLGLILGAGMLMRYANVVFGIIPLIDLLSRFEPRKCVRFLALPLGMAAVFSLQIAVWKASFGRFFLVPQGEGFMHWTHPHLMEMAFSHRHGLLAAHVLVPLGILGYFFLARQRHLDVAGAVGVIMAVFYINAAADDWWAGHAFGARRFDSLMPFVILGLAHPMQRLHDLLTKWNRLVLVLLSTPFVTYNAAYLDYYRQNIDMRDKVITPIMVLAHAYERMGSMINLPSNLYFSVKHGIPLGKAEVFLGNYLDIDRNGLIDPALDRDSLIDGWEDQVTFDGNTAVRFISRRQARVGFSLRTPEDKVLAVRFRMLPPGAKTTVFLRLNDHSLVETTVESGETLTVPVPRAALQTTMHVLTITSSLPPHSTTRLGVELIRLQ